MFIHFHSSLKYHTLFQTKMSKVYAHFQTETAPNSKPFEAAHTYKAYTCMREVPPWGQISYGPTYSESWFTEKTMI